MGAFRIPSSPGVGLPLLAGLIIRVAGLSHLSYWYDEVATLASARQPVASILAFTSEQIFHPPLYYLLLHCWLAAGDGEAWTRLLSALFGIATIPATYTLGTAWWDRRAGTAAAWLLALSPWHIWYSQETRMYAMVCFFSTLALWGGAVWLRGGGWWPALGYLAATVLGLYTNYTMFFIWPAVVVGLPVLLGVRGSRPRGWVMLQGGIILGYAPYLLFLPLILSGIWTSGYLQLAIQNIAGSPQRLALFAGAGVLAAAVAVVGLRRVSPARRQIVPAIGILVLLAGAALAMLSPSGTLLKRQLSIFAPLLCLAAAWALSRLRGRAGQVAPWAIGSAVIAGLVFVFVPKEEWRSLVADLNSRMAQGDALVIMPSYYTLPFDYYDHATHVRVGVEPGEIAPALAQQLAPHPRLWLILGEEAGIDPGQSVRRWFGARYHLVDSRDYFRLTLQEYSPASP